jgi:hypothetical protein
MLKFSDYKPVIEGFKRIESDTNTRVPGMVVAKLQSMGSPNHDLSKEAQAAKNSPSFDNLLRQLRNSLLEYIAHNYSRSKEIGLEAIIHKFFSDKTQKLVIGEAADLLKRMHEIVKLEMPARS